MSPDLLIARNTLVNRAAFASVTVAIILILAKLWAWWITGAVSLQATLIDSLLDSFASLANLFAVRLAQRPPDHRHRFGYGKFEAISALGQAFLILTSGLWLIQDALSKSLNPIPLKETSSGIAVMIFSLVATGVLLSFQRYVVRKTKSAAISADAAHYRVDFIINIGVILSLVITQHTSLLWFDSLSGLVIGVYILVSCISVGREAINILIDRELGDNMRHKIGRIINKFDAVKGFHDLRTRNSGNRIFIQCHLELNGNLSLHDAHDIAVDVRKAIREGIPESDVLLHLDPEDDSSYDHE